VLTAVLKEKTCPVCSNLFMPVRPMQGVCGPKCAMKKVREEKSQERAKTRQRKEAIKTIADLIREAQAAFNAFIRARDEGKPCICCGRTTDDNDLLTGSRWDAGHYRSTGSASHLRFHEDNCHRQLVRCNRHGAGRAVDYRIGLIARIGLARVEALESDNTTIKWTREYLVELKATFRRKLRELKARAA
jgi:hypothetical protein